jgi:hypothetical protein
VYCHLDNGPYLGAYFIGEGSNVTRIAALDLDDHEGVLAWDTLREVAARLSSIGKKFGLEAWPIRSGGGRGIHLLFRWDDPQDGAAVRARLLMVLDAAGFSEGNESFVGHDSSLSKSRWNDFRWLGAEGGPLALNGR